MTNELILPLLHDLACCFQAFEQLSGRQIRSLGLTPSQFDIIATLGKNKRMNCGDLGEKTLITKGTLTGVLDRLELKNLVLREESTTDRRSIMVSLTPAGEALYHKVYAQYQAYLTPAFDSLDAEFLSDISTKLKQLQHTMQQYGGGHQHPKN